MKSLEINLFPKGIAIAGLSSLALLASGCSAEFTPQESAPQPSESPSSADQSFVAGCEPYTVYSQNRWPLTPNTDSYGAAVRSEPVKKEGNIIGSYAGNDLITVDGWKSTEQQVYPQNVAPFNSGVWFHVASGDGTDSWVSYAGTRGEAVAEQDPTGESPDGKLPAELKPECEIK